MSEEFNKEDGSGENAWEDPKMWERYRQAVDALVGVPMGVSGEGASFFAHLATRVRTLDEHVGRVRRGEWESRGESSLKQDNNQWYEELLGGYPTSYANPTYAVECLGERMGRALCFAYAEGMELYALATEKKLWEITILLELYVELYREIKRNDNEVQGNANLAEEERARVVEAAIYRFVYENSGRVYLNRVREAFDPSIHAAKDVVMHGDLGDASYLYRFGEYVSDNEIRMAEYMNGLPEQDVKDMAHTFTDAFRRGFEVNRVDLSKKQNVQIRYVLGMERMVREAVKQFEGMGLRVILPRRVRGARRPWPGGYQSLRPYRQFLFDHRFDDALYLDEAMVERRLACLRSAHEAHKDLTDAYAGPAVIEMFGEVPFSPLVKAERLQYDEGKRRLALAYQTKSGLVMNEYVNKEEYSFTMMAFPIPEIVEDGFEQIFQTTMKINTLDNRQYERIQQTIIDVLDQGEYVRVTGKASAGNQTHLEIYLADVRNPERETRFENCLADVNIPVGEVFTSPRLAGTKGLLHVSETHLRELKYMDLKLWFEDGRVSDYQCANFPEEGENKAYIKGNLLLHNETLPMGEFAIGTNTTAYRMGRQWGISYKLPVLIAEKAGLHVAIGDTCYSMSEDKKVYNPDGKEIIARENEYSALRQSDGEKAYFHCHTDITIPYNELGDVVACHKDGTEVYVIRDGRFVLAGTEALNEALED